jgi:hypothetical protein
VNWEGVGILRKDEAGHIVFEPAPANGLFMAPTPALRVNRQNAQHTLLVGDQEMTNVEMNEWLLDEEAANKKKRSWWIAALVLAVLGFLGLVWHFYAHGWSISNQNSLLILR